MFMLLSYRLHLSICLQHQSGLDNLQKSVEIPKILQSCPLKLQTAYRPTKFFYTVLHTKQNDNYKLYQYQSVDFSYLQRRQQSSSCKAACSSFCSNRPIGFRNSSSRKVSSPIQRIPKTSCLHIKFHLFTYQVLSQDNSTHLKLASFSTAVCKDEPIPLMAPTLGNEVSPRNHEHKNTTHLVPSHWLSPEQGTCQFHRKSLLVVLWFVLRHSEQHCSCICCY